METFGGLVDETASYRMYVQMRLFSFAVSTVLLGTHKTSNHNRPYETRKNPFSSRRGDYQVLYLESSLPILILRKAQHTVPAVMILKEFSDVPDVLYYLLQQKHGAMIGPTCHGCK